MTARQGSYTVNYLGRALPLAGGGRREAYGKEAKGSTPKPRAPSPGRAEKKRDKRETRPVGYAARTGRGRPGSKVR